jgi:hypothetical protein
MLAFEQPFKVLKSRIFINLPSFAPEGLLPQAARSAFNLLMFLCEVFKEQSGLPQQNGDFL